MDYIGHRKEHPVTPLYQGNTIIQPFEKVLIEVGVGIDQAGDHSAVGRVDHVPIGLGHIVARTSDTRPFNEHIAIELDAFRRTYNV